MTGRELGGTFQHAGVAAAYEHRPPYPDEVFDVLDQLVVDEPRSVLDLGAGDGALARPLAPRVDRVDAVDVSAAMVDAGRGRPGGRHPNLRWVVAPAETAELDGPYALVTAGASLHWMDWRQVLPRLAGAMTPRGQLVVVEHGPTDEPWREGLVRVIQRHSRNPDYDPGFSLVGALEERALFRLTGRVETAPVVFRQAVPDYIEQFHSTATLAREHMTGQETASFARAIEEAVRPWAEDGVLELEIVAQLSWGRPASQGG